MQSHQKIISDLLVEQSYWDESYQDKLPEIAPPADAVRQWLEAHLPTATSDQQAVEVGCYPGRYLSVLGKMGYTIHGIDLTPSVLQMKKHFAEQHYSTGEFIQADFLSYAFSRQYDLVCSFGFIEHFIQWEKVLKKHADMVQRDGLLVIETPNFKGWLQQCLHRHLDAVNFRRHNIQSMNPEKWQALLEKNGFEILWKGYFGLFEFWSDSKEQNRLRKAGLKLLDKLLPLLKKIPEGNAALSPYCGIIARRRK